MAATIPGERPGWVAGHPPPAACQPEANAGGHGGESAGSARQAWLGRPQDQSALEGLGRGERATGQHDYRDPAPRRLDPKESPKHRAWQRFEAEAANDLWQMDFKGHI